MTKFIITEINSYEIEVASIAELQNLLRTEPNTWQDKTEFLEGSITYETAKDDN